MRASLDQYFHTQIQRQESLDSASQMLAESADALGWDLIGFYLDNDARYQQFIAPCYGGQTPALGCTTDPTTLRTTQNLAGSTTGLAPKWVGTLGADYGVPLGAVLRLDLSANARYSSSYLLSPFGNPLDRQGAYTSYDAAVRLGAADKRWEIAVIGKNLSNEYILTYGQDAPTSGSGTGTPAGQPSDQYGNPMPPRTVQGQVTLRF